MLLDVRLWQKTPAGCFWKSNEAQNIEQKVKGGEYIFICNTCCAQGPVFNLALRGIDNSLCSSTVTKLSVYVYCEADEIHSIWIVVFTKAKQVCL